MKNNDNIIIKEVNFTWDEDKNISNKKKHGVSFYEAASVFFDEHALVIPDPKHSEQEERFIILGMSSEANLLVVIHCFNEEINEFRIISARRATRSEANEYAFN